PLNFDFTICLVFSSHITTFLSTTTNHLINTLPPALFSIGLHCPGCPRQILLLAFFSVFLLHPGKGGCAGANPWSWRSMRDDAIFYGQTHQDYKGSLPSNAPTLRFSGCGICCPQVPFPHNVLFLCY